MHSCTVQAEVDPVAYLCVPCSSSEDRWAFLEPYLEHALTGISVVCVSITRNNVAFYHQLAVLVVPQVLSSDVYLNVCVAIVLILCPDALIAGVCILGIRILIVDRSDLCICSLNDGVSDKLHRLLLIYPPAVAAGIISHLVGTLYCYSALFSGLKLSVCAVCIILLCKRFNISLDLLHINNDTVL